MIRFILHGGATSKNLTGNYEFFKSINDAVDGSRLRVLLCYWAREKEEWKKLKRRDEQLFLAKANKEIEFDVLKSGLELREKLKLCDVLYISGGKAELIEPYYLFFNEIKNDLEGKIIVGSSMGAMCLVESYVLSFVNQDQGKVRQGMGWLPIQLLCHWDIEKLKKEKVDLLSAFSAKPISTLNEGEMVNFYIKL